MHTRRRWFFKAQKNLDDGSPRNNMLVAHPL